ncbi:MAG: hypothetical protein ACREPM_21990 [Gemmatimonadaceae bacterium]
MSQPAVLSPPASLHGVQRLLASLFPESEPAASETPLELTTSDPRPARLMSATLIEDRELQARTVAGDPEANFVAFLDGTQSSVVAQYQRGGVPIVLGTVAGVIRERRDRRLHTWRHVVERRLYAPKAQLARSVWDRLESTGLDLRDIADEESANAAEHPLAMREAAVHRVQKDREHAERALAIEWCGRDQRGLFVDGPISGADAVARAQCAVGVVKTHRTLYASGDALAKVLSLGHGERTSVFLVTSPKRATVASWYLRIREPKGHDPMWALLRVEIAADGLDAAGATRRADQVSRWILAEVAPVSLPDGRWDKMVYGVRDCEEFLRAIV